MERQKYIFYLAIAAAALFVAASLVQIMIYYNEYR